jgi:hypothetical protein
MPASLLTALNTNVQDLANRCNTADYPADMVEALRQATRENIGYTPALIAVIAHADSVGDYNIAEQARDILG